MVHIIDHVEVRKRIKKKQSNEVELTHKLFDIFNTGPQITSLRKAVRAGLGAVLEGEDLYLQQAAHEERFLQVWKNQKVQADRIGVQTLYDRLGTQPTSFHAADCNDLFRFIGAWVEKDKGSRMAEKKQEERAGAGPQGDPWSDRFRQRESIVPSREPKTRGNVTFDETPFDVRRELLRYREDKHKLHVGLSGRELKRIPKGPTEDSVLKIDQLFGLRDVCSISGTTADVMFILKEYGKDLGPIYRVLPFGTIAGFHHHSILEVALPQSLKDYIDYRIGFYSTIVPQDADPSPLASSIKNVAMNHERFVSQNGLHMICFYDKGFPEGAIVLTGGREIDRFYNSTLSSAKALSGKVPGIKAGRLTFKETLAAVETIDPAFARWLKTELWQFDRDKYDRAMNLGLVR